MAKKEKTVLYKYKNKRGEEEIGFITPKKARGVESFKKYATRKHEDSPEKENKKSK